MTSKFLMDLKVDCVTLEEKNQYKKIIRAIDKLMKLQLKRLERGETK